MEFLYEQSEQIFDSAIKEGVLSDNEQDKNYAGNFMYMYTDNGVHYFKHSITRKYGYNKETIIEACKVY